MALTVTRKCLCCKRYGVLRSHCRDQTTCHWWKCPCGAINGFRQNHHYNESGHGAMCHG